MSDASLIVSALVDPGQLPGGASGGAAPAASQAAFSGVLAQQLPLNGAPAAVTARPPAGTAPATLDGSPLPLAGSPLPVALLAAMGAASDPRALLDGYQAPAMAVDDTVAEGADMTQYLAAAGNPLLAAPLLPADPDGLRPPPSSAADTAPTESATDTDPLSLLLQAGPVNLDPGQALSVAGVAAAPLATSLDPTSAPQAMTGLQAGTAAQSLATLVSPLNQRLLKAADALAVAPDAAGPLRPASLGAQTLPAGMEMLQGKFFLQQPMAGFEPLPANLPTQLDRLLSESLPDTGVAEQRGVESLFSTTLGSENRSVLSPAVSALPSLPVQTGVGQNGWSGELGQRMVWLANQDVREAQLQLNPRHLGPVEVRISYGENQQLNVNFFAHHPQAREALDAALPRLREMFDQQGLNLADASVSQESFREQRQASGGDDGSAKQSGSLFSLDGEALDADPSVPIPIPIGAGLLNAYA